MNPTLSDNETYGPNISRAINDSLHSSECAYCIVTLPGTYTGTGTGVITASANGAIAAQNGGPTPAAGDYVWLMEGGTHVTAADAGMMYIVAPGSASTPYQMKRPGGWAHGATIVPGSCVRVSGLDLLFGGALIQVYCAATAVVDTNAPLAYPDKVTQLVTLTSGTHAAITNVPIRPTSVGPSGGGKVTGQYAYTYGVSANASTVGYGASTFTAGALGTATFTPVAFVAGQTINSSDGSHAWFTVEN